MIRRTLIALIGLLASCGVHPLPVAAQALSWTPRVLRGLYVLTRGLDHEVVVCGLGFVRNDTTVVVALFIPSQVSDTARVSILESCPTHTVVEFHNHPWTGPAESAGVTVPLNLCSLSGPDSFRASQIDAEWVAVGVGRWDPREVYLCWWRREQTRKVPITPWVEGQGIRYSVGQDP